MTFEQADDHDDRPDRGEEPPRPRAEPVARAAEIVYDEAEPAPATPRFAGAHAGLAGDSRRREAQPARQDGGEAEGWLTARRRRIVGDFAAAAFVLASLAAAVAVATMP